LIDEDTVQVNGKYLVVANIESISDLKSLEESDNVELLEISPIIEVMREKALPIKVKFKCDYCGKDCEAQRYETTRLIPFFPSSNEFKRDLRNELLKDWNYAAHYVDSAIRTAYSILGSWRQNYLEGLRRKRRPIVKREFVRVKTTLVRVEGARIRVTVEPRRRYFELDFSEEWFYERVKDCKIGELIIKEREAYITFKRKVLRSRRTNPLYLRC